MIVIRQSQFQAFERAAEDRLPQELAGYLSDRYSEDLAGISEPVLAGRVAYAIEQARQRGFQDANSIAGFAVLMFIIGPAFFEHPLLERILLDGSRLPLDRLERLPHEVSPGVWLEAQRISRNRWPDDQGA